MEPSAGPSSPKSRSSVLKYLIPVCGSTSAIFRSNRFDVRSGDSDGIGAVSSAEASERLRGLRRLTLSRRGRLSAGPGVCASASVGPLDRGRLSRVGRVSRSSTPDPKSSSEAGGVTSGVSSDVLRRPREGEVRLEDVVRVELRRRDGLVPSESERLVGIDCDLKEPEGWHRMCHWMRASATSKIRCFGHKRDQSRS